MISNLLTTSRARTARGCKRKHHIIYELGYRPTVEAEELFFGSLVHVGLEAWWRAVQATLPSDAWLEQALAALAANDGKQVDPFTAAKAEVMVRAYHVRWEADAAFFEVLGVEEQFECELVNPETGAASRTWRQGGKLDVRARDRRDGLVKFLEHKTSSEDISPGSAYWRRLRMDGQVSIYFDGCEALGTPAAACIYDVLGKPQQRPSQVPVTDETGVKVVLNAQGERVRTAKGKWRETADKEQGFVVQTRPETVDEYKARVTDAICADWDRYFARGEVVRLDTELKHARADLWELAKELREGELAGRAQRNPDACESYGRLCPYFDVCTGAASLDDPSRFRRTERVHPELAPVPQASSSKEESTWQHPSQ